MKETLLFLLLAAAPLENRAEWFESLKQPGTGASCCSIADCRKTEAVWQDGWWVKWQGKLTPIPSEIILERKSIDEDAYLCSSNSKLLCFVPPLNGF